MAKKETKKVTRKPKNKAVYRDQEYTVLERNEDKVCLTDGLIHFWVRTEDVQTD